MNRETVIARLKKAEPELRVRGVAHLYLYGSYARDEARPDSDIDVLIDFDSTADQGLVGYMAPYLYLEKEFPGMNIGYTTSEGIVPMYRSHIEQSTVQVF